MSEAKIPDDLKHCWYCDQDNCDHKHGDGSSCGDCCAMHGGTSQNRELHQWIYDCLQAKNKRIADLEAQLAALQWRPISKSDLPKVGDEVMDDICMATKKVDAAMAARSYAAWRAYRWTFFRTINPPTQDNKEIRGE